MDKLKMHTKSKVDINIESIGALFPNTVTETIRGYDENNNVIIEKTIDFDVLKQELSKVIVEGREERYQMNWPGKKEAILTANNPISKTLRPCREDSVNFDETENLYIEGDNLEVLKLLQETYLNRVKMIYIDPPYNTGNDSFVYNDNFQMSNEEFSEASGQYDENGNLNYDIRKNNESNGKFHTDWLNMMYPRLKLAKDLLRDDGVICISIDDNELKNLMKVCDEVFGESNFVSMITVIVKTEGRRYGYFAKTHESILIYAKNITNINLNEIEVEGTKFNYYDEIGGYNLTDLRNQNARAFNSTNRPNLRYPFYVDCNNPNKDGLCKVSTIPVDEYMEVYAITVNGNKSVWRWGKEKAAKEINNLVARKSSDGDYRIFQKYRKLTQTAKTVWADKTFISNKGTKELQEILGIGIFDFPKPLALLKQLCVICSNQNDIVLDFFSGSATTAHAVMQLNAEDGGNRKFVMVQLPEVTDDKSEARKAGYENICEIGKERIRRAGKKIIDENPEVADKLDIGFRVLKLDSSNMKDVYYNPNEYTQDMLSHLESNIKDDRTSEDLLFQVMLDLGELLSSDIREIGIEGKKVFNVGDGNIVACFDDEITNEVLTEIAKIKPLYAVFRDSALSNDSVATNFEQIFKTYSPNTIRKVL